MRSPYGACGAGLALLLVYAFSPRSYSIDRDSILVHRLAGNVRIPLDGVRQARMATPEDFAGRIRLIGSGGMCGYYGIFWTASLGKSTWYRAHRKNAVVVVTDSGTTLYSPDDPEAFLALVRAAI